MDKLTAYQQLIERYLTAQAAIAFVPATLRYTPVLDRERGHFLLLVTGYDRQERVHRCDIHLSLHDGQVWLEELNADVDVLADLREAGIPAADLRDDTHPIAALTR